MKNLKDRANHLINKCNGDIEFAKEITFNNAVIASYQDNIERLDNEVVIYSYLKKSAKHRKEF